jgi:type I restriction enzyme M protein
VKTAVLVFRRPASETAKRLEKVWFYEIRNDGYDPDKISGGGRIETPEKNDIPELLQHWKKYKASGFTIPPGLEAKTQLPFGSEDPTCWWTTPEKIELENFNLGAGQWKPRISEQVKEEDLVELVSGALSDYRNVFTTLERLQLELSQ